jgi:hypothetical protein
MLAQTSRRSSSMVEIISTPALLIGPVAVLFGNSGD